MLPPHPPPPFWLLFIQVFPGFSKGWNNMNSSLFVKSSMRPQITHTQAPAFKITCTTSILPWGQWQQLWQPPGTDHSRSARWTFGQKDCRLRAGCSAMTSWMPGRRSAGHWWGRGPTSPCQRSLISPAHKESIPQKIKTQFSCSVTHHSQVLSGMPGAKITFPTKKLRV